MRLVKQQLADMWPFQQGNSVVWHDQINDLALIQLSDPDGHPLDPPLCPELQLRIASINYARPVKVEARGYPQASKEIRDGKDKKGPRKLVPAYGRLSAAEPHEPLLFGLDSGDAPDDPREGWPGMSGSAVMLQDAPDQETIWLYGVVLEVPANFRQQLRVTRLAEVWQQDPDFRKRLVTAGVPDKDAKDPTDVQEEPDPKHSPERDNEALKLWLSLELSSADQHVTEAEGNALWRLACGARSLKRAFLDLLLDQRFPGLGVRFGRAPRSIARALVGLDFQVRNFTRQVLRAWAPEGATDPRQLAASLLCTELEIRDATGHILASLRNAPPEHASRLVQGLVSVEGASHLPTIDILEAVQSAIHSTKNATRDVVGQIDGLMDGLPTLARLLTPEFAATAADACLDAKIPPGLLGAVLGALPIELGVARTSAALDYLLGSKSSGQINGRTFALFARHWREDAAEGLTRFSQKLASEEAFRAICLVLEGMSLCSTAPSSFFRAVGKTLATLAGRLADEQAAKAGEKLIDLMQTTARGLKSVQEYFDQTEEWASWPQPPTGHFPRGVSNADVSDDRNRLVAYGEMLSLLAPRIGADLTSLGFETAVLSLKVLQEEDSALLRPLGNGLMALAERLPITHVAECLRQLLAELKQPLNLHVPVELQRSITVLARRLGHPPDAARVEALLGQITETPAEAYLRLDALVSALEWLRPPPDVELVSRAVEAILLGAHDLLSPIAWSLPVPAARASRAVEVEKIANVLTRLIETTSPPAGSGRLESAKMGVYKLNREIANILDESRRSLPAIFASMSSKGRHEKNTAFWGACALYRVLSDEQIKDALEAMSDAIRSMEAKNVTEADRTEYLLEFALVVSCYTSNLTSDQLTAVTTLVVRCFDQLHRTVVHSDLQKLSEAIALVAGKARSDRAFAFLILEALKYPLAPREPLADALRSRFPDAPDSKSGFWALIDWATKCYPELDLTEPQKSAAIASKLCAEVLG